MFIRDGDESVVQVLSEDLFVELLVSHGGSNFSADGATVYVSYA